MKKLLLLGIAASALVLGAAPQIKGLKETKEERDATIIVKMNTNVENYSQKQLRSIQNSLLNEISYNVTSNYKVKTRYSNIFNGFVLEVPSAYVTKIRGLNRVDKVNYNIMLEEEVTNNDGYNYIATESIDKQTSSTSTMKKPEGTNDGKGTFIAILDTCFYIKTDEEGHQEYHHVFAPLANEDAVLSQADVKARIDAKKDSFHGLYDETHSTYYNNKVIFYYDYAGDESGGLKPDYDVFSEGSDHGTHVASLAGGNAGEEFEGIAPKAQMALMKVFRVYLSGQSYVSGAPADAVLSALEDCLILGVDTLNMSLGSNLNDFDDAEIVQDVIRSLDEKGTFVNVAAGNEGKGQYHNTIYEYWSTDMIESNIISSYANNNGSMTIASSQADTLFYGSALTLGGENLQYTDQVTNYQSTTGPVTYNPERHLVDIVEQYGKSDFDFLYLPGVGKEAEYSGLDATGKIVFTNRGDLTFKEKVEIATAQGAAALAIINNEGGNELKIRMSFGDNFTPEIPVVFMLQKVKTLFEKTTETQVSFLINTVLPNPEANTISSYSSDGMKYDLTIKPEISAPGEEIKGAVPGAVDKYEAMSGTSMATPNFTGGIALMIGEHLGDSNYRNTIKARLMSTAEPMLDYFGTTYTSVRRQGAGLVNLDSALNSEVYLDGLDAQGNRLGKAKVEFFNNDNIKAGKINMKFAAINEGSEPVTYTATTYVMAPGTATPTELNENYKEFENHTFQVIEDQLVEKFEESVTIQPGEHTITLQEHQVAADKLAALRETFENGCVLEGFTILTAQDKPQLSIPFLGFYGDLASVSPVEPFDYDRVEGKLYDSDILNSFLRKALVSNEADYSKTDFRSHIVSGYWESKSKVSISNYFRDNSNNILNMTDGNSNRVKMLGSNPFDGSLSDRWVVGNNGFSNMMIIQQYVTRSVKDNHIYLRNKATQEVVATEQMIDTLMGTSSLYKSHFDYTGLFENGYMAHRAYCVFPLFKVEGSKFVPYADGEYELEFEYELAAGSTFKMTYDLTIESDLPVLQSFERVGDNYRLHYNDANAAVAYINDKPYKAEKDENGNIFVDVPASLFAENDKALIRSVDEAYGQETFLTHFNDPYQLMVYNKMFSTTYDFTTEVTKASANDLTFSLNITSNGKNASTNGNITYRLPIPEGIDKNTVKAYSVATNGKEKELKVTFIDGLMQFETTTRVFHIVSEPVTLDSIAVVAGKTEYNQGESIDLSTITVTATYSDGNTKVLTSGEFTVSPTELTTAGQVTITVTSGGKSATFEVTVKAGENPNPDKPAKKGCGGSIIATSAIISIASLLGAGLLLFKRKED